MTCRRSPSGGAQGSPSESLSFTEVYVRVTRQGRRRHAVALHTQQRPVLARPVAQRLYEPLIQKLSQRSAPVASNGRSLRSDVKRKCRQVRRKVISSSLLELDQKIVCPIRVVNFQAVAKNSKRSATLESAHQLVACVSQIGSHGRCIKVIQHKTFRTYGGALDLHSSAA